MDTDCCSCRDIRCDLHSFSRHSMDDGICCNSNAILQWQKRKRNEELLLHLLPSTHYSIVYIIDTDLMKNGGVKIKFHTPAIFIFLFLHQ